MLSTDIGSSGLLIEIAISLGFLAILTVVSWLLIKAAEVFWVEDQGFRTTMRPVWFLLILGRIAVRHPYSFSIIKPIIIDLRLLFMLIEEMKVVESGKEQHLQLLVLRWMFIKGTDAHADFIKSISSLSGEGILALLEERKNRALTHLSHINMEELSFKLSEGGVKIFECERGLTNQGGLQQKGLRWMEYAGMLRRVLAKNSDELVV